MREKNLKKIDIHVCIHDCMNHFAVHLEVTQHCKSAILQ